jgi:transglutaminase-like putative cysteine protease
VNLIPDSLKDNANAVIRYEEYHISIKSIDRAIVKHKYAITILNEDGNGFAEYSNDYSQLNSLSDISGHLYNASGKKLKSVKKADIQDEPESDGFSLHQDDRVKKHNFYCNDYPYTVEYEDEQEYKGIYFLPYWQPIEKDKISVQQDKFIVETPAGYQLRYKQFNYGNAPKTIEAGNIKTYFWEVNNLKAFEYEPYQPAYNEINPSVYMGPTEFSIGGYTGKMDSWLNLGLFQNTLNKGRDQLPEHVKQEIHQISDNIPERKEKVKALYSYMQNNTRYISIQLGIGGWQPFDAKFVAEKKYGDCKALSNFMVSILKEAGIKANYVLVNAGKKIRRGLNEDFPAPYFNHVIACVPDGKDTIWLECTSQYNNAGYMGSFTGNRQALLIDEDGGHVVRTPLYTSLENKQIRKINASVDVSGNLKADIITHFTGEQQETEFNMIHYYTKDQREKFLNEMFDLPTYQIEKVSYAEKKEMIPEVDEILQLVAPNYASITGKRIFIHTNILNKSDIKFKADDNRKFPIVYPNAFKDVDSIAISIPEGYVLESVPKNVIISNKFGFYSVHYSVIGNNIEVIRLHQRDAAIYPSTDYPDFAKYYADIFKADHSQVVFVKKTE